VCMAALGSTPPKSNVLRLENGSSGIDHLDWPGSWAACVMQEREGAGPVKSRNTVL